MSKKHKKKLLLDKALLLPAVAASLVVFLCLFPTMRGFFAPDSQQIVLCATGQQAEWSTDNRVVLQRLWINEVLVEADAVKDFVQSSNGWVEVGEGTEILAAQGPDTRLVLVFEKTARVDIQFKTGISSGYLQISGEDFSETHNLALGEGNYLFTYAPFSLLFLFCSIALIVLLFMLMYAGMVFVARKSASIANMLRHPLCFILLLGIAVRLHSFMYYQPAIIYADSIGYLDVKSVGIGGLRTPIYPIIIQLMGLIFGPEWMQLAVVRLQSIVVLMSVCAFYYIARRFLQNRFLVIAGTLVYACLPGLASWEVTIMTESFNVACTLFFLAMIVRYLQDGGNVLAVLIGTAGAGLVMLRPSNLFIVAVLGLFWLVKLLVDKNKQDLFGLAGATLCVALVLGYCLLNSRVTGYFGLTNVGVEINQGYMLVDNPYLYQNEEYPEIVKAIEQRKSEGQTTWNIINNRRDFISEQEWSAYVSDTLAKNRDGYIAYTYDKTADLMGSKVAINYPEGATPSPLLLVRLLDAALFPLTFGAAWVLVLWEVAYLLYYYIKTKHFNWIECWLCCLCGGTFVTVFIGAQNEWSRLSQATIPLLVLLLLLNVQRLVHALAKKELREVACQWK